MHDESLSKEPETADPDARYFELGTKFLAECHGLLGCQVTEPHHTVGELDPDVKRAMSVLALSTIWRMTRIMDNDLTAGRDAGTSSAPGSKSR